MRKQQIERIAGSLKDARDAALSNGNADTNTMRRIFDSLARSIADCIASETARFQRPKFLAQCGVERP